MKNKYKFLALLGFLPFLAQAQLTNNGATIVIESGATLVVEGAITNNTSGVITNSGTIEVKGNLTNAATITSNAGSLVKFTGTAADQTVTSNGAVFNNIEMATTGQDVILADAMAVNGDINFSTDNNQIVLGDFDLTLGDAATVTSPDANEYIVATGLGVVSKGFGTAATFTYPVGGLDYSPLAVDVGAMEASSQVSINVTESAVGALPADAIDHIERYWDVSKSGFAAFSASLDGTYVAGDIAAGGSNVANIKGAAYNETSTEWSYDAATASALVASGDIDDDVLFTGSNSFARQPIKVFLAGPLSGTTMSTALNTGGHIPLISPYDAGVSVASIPNANVVDWVTVELRDPANSATVLSTYSKFLLNNGDVVNLDGSTNATFRDGASDAFIAVNHRNHLGAMTAANLLLGSVTTLDFSTMLDINSFGTGSQNEGGSVNAMWGGDVTGDKIIRVISSPFPFPTGTPSDSEFIFVDILGSNSNGEVTGYNLGDINMDGKVRLISSPFPFPTGTPSDAEYIFVNTLGSLSNGQVSQSY